MSLTNFQLFNVLWTGLSPLAQQVLSAALQASLVAAVMLLLLVALKRFSAPLRYGLLLVALVKFAVPVLPAPTGMFPWLGEQLSWSQDGPAFLPAQASTAQSSASVALSSTASPATHANPAVSAASTAGPGQPSSWEQMAWMLYGLGLFVGFTRLLIGARRLALRRRASTPCSDERTLELYAAAAEQLGLKGLPELRLETRSASPVAFGLLRPVVLLPAAALGELDDTALKAVLAHELGHHRRRDLWVHTLQRVLAVIWWPNPLFHGLDRALRRVREECCDDLVLERRVVEDGAYCRALLDTVALCGSNHATAGQASSALALGGSGHALRGRLSRILDGRSVRRGELGRPALALLLVGTVWLLPGQGLEARPDSPSLVPSTEAEDSGAVDDPLLAEIRALHELELRQLWPRFLLHELKDFGGLSLGSLKLEQNAYVVGLDAEELPMPTVEAVLFALRPSPLKRTDMLLHGPNVSSDAALALTARFEGADGDEQDATSPLEERAALIRSLLHVEDNVPAVVRGLKVVTEKQHGLKLLALQPRVAMDFAHHREWPVELEVEGDAPDRMALLYRYSLFPGVLIHEVESVGDDRIRVELRLVQARPADAEPTGAEPERRFQVSPERLRSNTLELRRHLLADLRAD